MLPTLESVLAGPLFASDVPPSIGPDSSVLSRATKRRTVVPHREMPDPYPRRQAHEI